MTFDEVLCEGRGWKIIRRAADDALIVQADTLALALMVEAVYCPGFESRARIDGDMADLARLLRVL